MQNARAGHDREAPGGIQRRPTEHVDAVLKLMSALTRDHRFEETQSEFREGEAVTMLSVLDKVEARDWGVVVGDVNALPLPHRPRQSFQSVLRERMAQVSFPFHLYGLATAWNFAGRSFLSSTL